MKVKMILPALTEARSPYFRPIKYALFPPLGLATLAAYLAEEDDIELQDEHVEALNLNDAPDLLVLEVYISSAYRAYQIADLYRSRGTYVVMGGLHVTSLPDEALCHADTLCLGPGEDTWPAFLKDFRAGRPRRVYCSTRRSLEGAPLPRRDLIKRELYLVPNSLVVSRGCPKHCNFCYKDAFYKGGRSFYTAPLERVFREIDSLPGRHLYFLDDNLFADPAFSLQLFTGLQGRGRLWQAAGTVQSVLDGVLIEKAAEAGLRSLFLGFETLDTANLREYGKHHNLSAQYAQAVKRLHELGIMVNASFVYGMDHDGPDVFRRTVDWAVEAGIETATFHILTPYPGTALHRSLRQAGRILTDNWDLYDTRHAVFRPAGLSVERLEEGYRQSYRDFYSWSALFRAAATKDSLAGKLRHLAYSGGWKKMETFWRLVVAAKVTSTMLPVLEKVLAGSRKTEVRAREKGAAMVLGRAANA